MIFALAIIFLPDILDGKKQQLRDDFKAIPLKPQYQSPDLSKALPVIDNKDAGGGDVDNTLVNGSVPAKSSDEVVEVAPVTSQISANSTKGASVVTSAAKPKPQLKQTSEPKVEIVTKKSQQKSTKGAWVITVGSFKDPSNVKALLAKLRKNGFTSFSVPNTPRKGETSKVFVGPSFNRTSLEKLQTKLKVVINEPGFITAYNATEK